MGSKVLTAYVVIDFLFVAMGALILGFCVIVQNTMNEAPADGVMAVRNLLYQMFPLTAGIVNAILMFITFLVSIPGIITPTRAWINLASYMTVISLIFTTILGLDMWILTLRSKATFSSVWSAQSSGTQDLMQTSFACCGYLNSTSPAFVTDATCPSPAAAALLRGCSAPISSFANVFIDQIFTAAFAIAALDGIFILAAACLLKERKEMERFRHIDEKTGTF